MNLSEFKNKYGFTDKIVLCDFNGIRYRDGDRDKEYVNAYSRHIEKLPPSKGDNVICFQGDDCVWVKGIVTTTPRIGSHFDSIGHTFEVDLDKDNYDYIDEYTFYNAIGDEND